MTLPPYRADLPFTYAFGRFAAHEALARRPQDVTQVLWHADLPATERARLQAAAAAAGVTARRDDAAVERLRRKGTVHCLAQVAKRAERLRPGADHVALLRPSHPGNVGTAIRSLVAFGFTDLALIGARIDPWGAYVVRSSVGLRFALACQEFGSLADYAAAFPRHALYLLHPEGAQELDEVEFSRPFALLFGPEWQEGPPAAGRPEGLRGAERPEGLRAGERPGEGPAVAGADAPLVTVRIPQGNRVESLNLGVSVSIAAYRARKLPD